MTELPGQPARLREGADAYAALAAEIDLAARELYDFVIDGESRAVDVIRARAAGSASLLGEAHVRYSDAAVALREYTVVLQRAHDRADTAAEAKLRHEAELAIVRVESEQVWLALLTLDTPGVAPARALEDLRVQRDCLSRRIATLEVACATAQLEIDAAAADMVAGAEVAVSRIDSSALLVRDGRVTGMVTHVGDALPELWSAFVEGFAMVASAVGATVALAQAAILGLVTLVAAAVTAFSGIRGDAASALLEVTSIASGPLSWVLACAVLVLAQFALLAAAERAAADAARPTPAVRPLVRPAVGSPERESWDLSQGQDQMETVDDFMRAAGYTDRIGGDRERYADDRTVVDIKATGSDPPHWIVTLPSTQDWQLAAIAFGDRASLDDAGPVNDLDSNLALMLYPQLQTQYERGVLEAMRQAGIAPTDPVMLVGFSQGGILAGHLAAHRPHAYNFTAVLAYGAPIDAMSIAATSHTGEPVRVVSIQHEGDIVHQLDGASPPSDRNHWSTLSEPPPEFLEDESPHDNERYIRTVETLLGAKDEGGASQRSARRAVLDAAFAAFRGRVRVHQQYEFAE